MLRFGVLENALRDYVGYPNIWVYSLQVLESGIAPTADSLWVYGDRIPDNQHHPPSKNYGFSWTEDGFLSG